MSDIDEITKSAEQKLNEPFVTRDVFDGKVQNIRGILEKLKGMFDISEFESELEQILADVNKDNDKTNKMPFKDMQPIYEHGVYKKYLDRINDLNKRLSSYTEFFDMHSLCTSIDYSTTHVNCENIGEIIRNTKTLIDIINSVNTFDDPRKIEIVKKSYNTIYSVMLYERIFERNDVFSYITSLDGTANRENIGRLLYKDITECLSKEELINLNIKNIDKDLDFDYLTDDVILTISRKKVGEKNSEYIMKRDNAVNSFVDEYNSIIISKNEQRGHINNARISNLKIYPLFGSLTLTAVPLILIPIGTFSGGKSLGLSESHKITEYGIVTRTVNPDTGKIIDGPEISYEEKTTGYSATILSLTPWKKSPSGVGYVSTVTAYEYIAPEDESEGFHADAETLETNNVRVKYIYEKCKDTLSEDDSMTEGTILITESYYDNSLDRPSNKYTVLFTVLGTLLGVGIDAVLVLIAYHNIDKIRDFINKLKDDIKNNKLTIEEAREKVKDLTLRAKNLQDKKKELNSKYGISDNELALRLKK